MVCAEEGLVAKAPHRSSTMAVVLHLWFLAARAPARRLLEVAPMWPQGALRSGPRRVCSWWWEEQQGGAPNAGRGRDVLRGHEAGGLIWRVLPRFLCHVATVPCSLEARLQPRHQAVVARAGHINGGSTGRAWRVGRLAKPAVNLLRIILIHLFSIIQPTRPLLLIAVPCVLGGGKTKHQTPPIPPKRATVLRRRREDAWRRERVGLHT